MHHLENPLIEYADDLYCGPVDVSAKTPTGIPKHMASDYTLRMPQALRQGRMDVERVRPGIMVTMYDMTPREDTCINFRSDSSPIGFGALVSGRLALSCDKGMASKGSREGKPYEMVCKGSGVSGQVTLPGGIPLRMVGVSIDENVLPDLLQGHQEYESLIDELARGESGFSIFGEWTLSPAMHVIVSQMLGCPLQGVSRALYLESKALEILALQLDKLANREQRSHPISRGDAERLHEARRLLFDSMEEPIGLVELAARVGLNDFKLKKGFRELFGTTVYGSLRTHRMETARSMLLDGDMTVSTVAMTVGYSNISHFIAAFKKHYDVTPGLLLQQSRRAYRKE